MKVGAEVNIASDVTAGDTSVPLILPGVGSFARAMNALSARGNAAAIVEQAARSRPILGVCLGMQLLFESSTEHGFSQGLSLIEGTVCQIDFEAHQSKKIHCQWNKLASHDASPNSNSCLDTLVGNHVYFMHGYKCVPAPNFPGYELICDYRGERIVAAVQHGNIVGTQFHPEKSGEVGLEFLGDFLDYCKKVRSPASHASV